MKKRNKIISYIVMTIVALTVLLPMLWAFSNAFRSNNEIASMTGLGLHTFIPKEFVSDNFKEVFETFNFIRIILNTLFVALTVTIVSLLFNALAGFAFARLEFPGKNILFVVFLATLMIPLEVLIIPLYDTIRSLGMMDSYSGLIIPFLSNAFGIFYMRQFISGIPKELDEAATIDGCGWFGVFIRVILPSLKPAMLTLGIIVFLQQWDSFIVPVTLIHSEEKMLLQVALQQMQFGLYNNNYGIMFAGIFISAVPIIIVFLMLQRYYVEGISSSGLKG
jgi:multiple sugar transport system permease protein